MICLAAKSNCTAHTQPPILHLKSQYGFLDASSVDKFPRHLDYLDYSHNEN